MWDFYDWYIDSDDFEEWLLEQGYSYNYGEKVARHFLTRFFDNNEYFEWGGYEFYPMEDVAQ